MNQSTDALLLVLYGGEAGVSTLPIIGLVFYLAPSHLMNRDSFLCFTGSAIVDTVLNPTMFRITPKHRILEFYSLLFRPQSIHRKHIVAVPSGRPSVTQSLYSS